MNSIPCPDGKECKYGCDMHCERMTEKSNARSNVLEEQAATMLAQRKKIQDLESQNQALKGLILEALDVWWPFVHGATGASDTARNLRKKLGDGIQPKSLLRAPLTATNPLPPGCYCKPGTCSAPKPHWCLNPERKLELYK